MPANGKRKDDPGKEDRVNLPYKTRLPVTDHPEPPSPVISPVVRNTIDPDIRLFNAVMNVLTSVFNPIFQTEAAKENSNRHSYHFHGLLTILEDFYKINLFSSYYRDDAAKHEQLTKERVATSSVSTNTEDTGRTEEEWEELWEEAADWRYEFIFKVMEGNEKEEEIYRLKQETTPLTPEKPTSNSVSTNNRLRYPDHTPGYFDNGGGRDTKVMLPPSGAGKGKWKEERTTHTSPPNSPNNPPSSRKGMERVHPDRIPQIQAGSTSAKKPATAAPPPNSPKRRHQRKRHPPPPHTHTNRTQAVVFHAGPMKYKPGLMRRWIEEDNQRVRIPGICWLQKGRRVGKLASSLVLHMAEGIDTTHGLRIGKRVFRTTAYNWNI
ncbi:hypothetical protein BGX38DRAFT_1146978 [Terfezia claveryi]|nr:hypothetical protein BGX38DRAFT_1146978 [Terfezia claveryi]